VTPAQVDVLYLTDAELIDAQPTPPLAMRVRGLCAIVFVGLGLLATVAWTGLLGWLLYRAALML
jgi:hypothetical protein